MMKKTGKNVVWIIAAVLLVVVLTSSLGLGTSRSAVCVGFVEHGGSKSWSASYMLLDGKLQHTLHLGQEQTITLEVETQAGSISVEMQDAQGKQIFYKTQMDTQTIQIPAAGKVVVTVKGDDHKGGFCIEPA